MPIFIEALIPPLLLGRAQGVVSAADMEVFTSTVDESFLGPEARFVLVVEVAGVRSLSAEGRDVAIAHRKANIDRLRPLELGVVLVVPSLPLRAAVKAVGWLGGKINGQRMTASREEAVSETRRLLEAHRVGLDAQAEAALAQFAQGPPPSVS